MDPSFAAARTMHISGDPRIRFRGSVEIQFECRPVQSPEIPLWELPLKCLGALMMEKGRKSVMVRALANVRLQGGGSCLAGCCSNWRPSTSPGSLVRSRSSRSPPTPPHSWSVHLEPIRFKTGLRLSNKVKLPSIRLITGDEKKGLLSAPAIPEIPVIIFAGC